MADTNNLTNFLTDIADAIRTKKETSGTIPAEQFDSEILSIETNADNVLVSPNDSETYSVLVSKPLAKKMDDSDTSNTAMYISGVISMLMNWRNELVLNCTNVFTVARLEHNKRVMLQCVFNYKNASGDIVFSTDTTIEKCTSDEQFYRQINSLAQVKPEGTIEEWKEKVLSIVDFDYTITILSQENIETGIDTSDATATENDIIINKTAYANGKKITGTLPLKQNGELLPFTIGDGSAVVQNTTYIDVDLANRTAIDNGNYALSVANTKLAKTIGLTADKIKKNEEILNVIGTYEGSGSGGSGDVKLFETEEQMQADENPQEGDKAVVYRKQSQSITQDTEFQVCEFPNTVALDTAFADNAYAMFRSVDPSIWFDANASISQTNFIFRWYSRNSDGEITYTSEDGITYTRTDTLGNPIDFGTIIKGEEYEWNDVFGKFIFSAGYYFGGLFEYGEATNTDYYLTTSIKNIDNVDTREQRLCRLPELNSLEGLSTQSIIIIKNMETEINNNLSDKLLYKATTYDVWNYGTSSLVSSIIDKGTTNLTLATLFDSGWTKYEIVDNELINTTSYTDSEITNMNPITCGINDFIQGVYNYEIDGKGVIVLRDGSNTTSLGLTHVPQVLSYNAYNFASTQLTLNNPNQLLPNIIAYGKNGIITGDGTVYNNLDSLTVLSTVLGYTPETISKSPIVSKSDTNIPVETFLGEIYTNNETDCVTHILKDEDILTSVKSKINEYVGTTDMDYILVGIKDDELLFKGYKQITGSGETCVVHCAACKYSIETNQFTNKVYTTYNVSERSMSGDVGEYFPDINMLIMNGYGYNNKSIYIIVNYNDMTIHYILKSSRDTSIGEVGYYLVGDYIYSFNGNSAVDFSIDRIRYTDYTLTTGLIKLSGSREGGYKSFILNDQQYVLYLDRKKNLYLFTPKTNGTVTQKLLATFTATHASYPNFMTIINPVENKVYSFFINGNVTLNNNLYIGFVIDSDLSITWLLDSEWHVEGTSNSSIPAMDRIITRYNDTTNILTAISTYADNSHTICDFNNKRIIDRSDIENNFGNGLPYSVTYITNIYSKTDYITDNMNITIMDYYTIVDDTLKKISSCYCFGNILTTMNNTLNKDVYSIVIKHTQNIYSPENIIISNTGLLENKINQVLNVSPITQEEYDKALDTANEIKGVMNNGK